MKLTEPGILELRSDRVSAGRIGTTRAGTPATLSGRLLPINGHPVVFRMWEDFNKVCDYVPISQVAEAAQLFAEFAPVEVRA